MRLQRLRYLLLLWGADRHRANPMTPEEVHRVANERLMQMMPQVLPSPDAMGPKSTGTGGIAQPTPQQPATGNAATAPVAPTQPAANRSPQRATPPQVVLNRLRVRREGNSGELSQPGTLGNLALFPHCAVAANHALAG